MPSEATLFLWLLGVVAAAVIVALALPAAGAIPKLTGCRFVTTDDGGWGYGTWWYCTTHRRMYPEQVFMKPPDKCRELK